MGYYIYDGDPHRRAASTYGTYVDNVKVELEAGTRLTDGCRIRLGRPAAEGRASPVIIRFEDLRKEPEEPVDADLTSDELIIEQVPEMEETKESAPEDLAGMETELEILDSEEALDDTYKVADIEGLVEGESSYETEDFDYYEADEDDLATEEFDPTEEES